VTDFVLDASLAIQWFLEDEVDREYSLSILAGLAESRAFVPLLWFYEIGNGLIMACRRKRVSVEQVRGFLKRLSPLPIYPVDQPAAELLDLPSLAFAHNLTNYDAAYLALAIKLSLPLATTDKRLQEAVVSVGLRRMTV
jgi:predicted nucleic acid-binding protein